MQGFVKLTNSERKRDSLLRFSAEMFHRCAPCSSPTLGGWPVAPPVRTTPSDWKNSAAFIVSRTPMSLVMACELARAEGHIDNGHVLLVKWQ